MRNLKSNLTKISAAALLGVVGLAGVNQAQNTNSTSSHTVEAATKVIQINYVPGYGIRVWGSAGTSKPTTQFLKHGTKWKALSSVVVNGSTWYNVGRNQWIEAKYAITPPPVVATNKVIQINYVPGYSIRVWGTAGTNKPTSQLLKHGTKWKVVSSVVVNGKTWYSLGLNQWIEAKYAITPTVSQGTTANAKIQSVISLAKQQIGKPYVWAGKGPSVFDCSGLMYYVFLNATGRNIGDWTVPQESAGRQVSTSQLQAGDLVFWGKRGNTHHVGLYLGNNQYLHSPQPGQTVTIASMSSYFTPSFGVRVF